MVGILTIGRMATAIALLSIVTSATAAASSSLGSRDPLLSFVPARAAAAAASRRRRAPPAALYRKFHDYAWERLTPSSGGKDGYDDDAIPEGLRSNSSPVRNAPPGTSVVATVRSSSRFPFLEVIDSSVSSSSSSSSSSSEAAADKVGDVTRHDERGDGGRRAMRLSRTAFLETRAQDGEAIVTNVTIHVLNLVSFPDPRIRLRIRDDDDDEDGGGGGGGGGGEYLGLPIFGADIVSLPGNKHLVALDFQPVLPLDDYYDDDDRAADGDLDGREGRRASSLFPERYSRFDDRLRALHSKYQDGDDHGESATPPLLPWGGDIPQKARRFFSPHALWTRLAGEDAIEKVSTVVWEAFREYTDLYLELMRAVQDDVDSGILEIVSPPKDRGIDIDNSVWRGQSDYLEYRRTNDPARPMLQRLYGNEWSESVIGVLFPDL
ncbi:hypothetical protein ACHAW5_001022 [Stephanodiscus triporus]|uniref:Uncharacterized protein n=1 Tax=Stephanodiscus triporus TaxID=2934178 RepID=A0ABD3PJM3_9STRA